MKFIDLFAGIGGIRLGMEQAGHECVAFCERDKFAVKSYKAIHNTEGEDFYDDITTVSDESWRRYKGTVDVICGGFPCQAFSVAGKRKGFDDVRGTMFFYLANAVKQIEPRYFIFENVKGLLNHDTGRTFGTILNALDELGYDVEWHVYNSKDYGVPQNRERVYIVGHSRRYGRREILPFGRENGAVVSESPKIEQIGNLNETDSFGGNPQVGRVYNSCGLAPSLNTMQGGGREPKILTVGNIRKNGKSQSGQVVSDNGIAPTANAVCYKDPTKILIKEATKKGYAEANVGDSVNYSIPTSKTRRGRVGKGVANTLDTGCQQGVVVPAAVIKEAKSIVVKTRGNIAFDIKCQYNGDLRAFRMDNKKSGIQELQVNNENNISHTITVNHAPKVYGASTNLRIRKLTPLECWRLQGFPDELFYKAQAVNSNSQLYKQAGNSVTVNVVYEVAKHLGGNGD